MRAEERMNLAHCQGNSLFGFFPREHAHFGFWREHCALQGDRRWVRGHLVWQDQDRVLAITYEIACHREDEVGVGFEHPGHKLIRSLHRDLGPLGGERRWPTLPKCAW